MDKVILREIQSMAEFRALLELQRQIWGMSDGEATSPYILAVVRHNGGVVIGAEIGGQLIGFCFGFPVRRGDNWLHWSHMAGVIPQFRRQGIGFKLKQAQRLWAIEQGYTAMSWTFDPLQRGNANFNFHQLGAVSNIYIMNHYGEMTDEINAGLASDRLEVVWNLGDERVVALAENSPLEMPEDNIEERAWLLQRNNLGEFIRAEETAYKQTICYVEIPYDINELKRDNFDIAQAWQLEVRWSLQQAFARDYTVIDFITAEQRGWYVLSKDMAMRSL